MAIALLQDFLGYAHDICMLIFRRRRFGNISQNRGRGWPSAKMVADDGWDRSRKFCRQFELCSGLQWRYSESNSSKQIQLRSRDGPGTSGTEEIRGGVRVGKVGRRASEDWMLRRACEFSTGMFARLKSINWSLTFEPITGPL